MCSTNTSKVVSVVLGGQSTLTNKGNMLSSQETTIIGFSYQSKL